VRSREARYLLRTNLSADNLQLIWRCYMQPCFVEEAFRTLTGDLGLRPILHQRTDRIEASQFIAFLAYCLSITLDGRELLLTRRTEPSADLAVLLEHLKLTLPPRTPPEIRDPSG
jgi:hypothetical protein